MFIIPGRLDIDNGIEECLTILAALEQVNYWGGEVHLYFLYPTSAEMLSLIQTHSDRLDLVPQIHLTDHIVEEREYRDFLIAVDGAIHLSRTVHGGYSGTLADCVSAGLPTVCNENLAPLWYGLTYVNIVPDSMSPLLLAGRIWDIAIAAIEHLKDETFRSRNVKKHGQFNHATQIIKLLLAS